MPSHVLAPVGWRLARPPDGPVRINYNSPQWRGLLVWYNALHVPAGPTIYDLTGKRHVGTMTTPTKPRANDRDKLVAFDMDGTSGNFTSPDAADLSPSSAISVSVTVKFRVIEEVGLVLKWNATGNQRSWMLITDFNSPFDEFYFVTSANGATTGTSTTTAANLQADTWYNIVATWQASQFPKLYVNGVAQAVSTAGTAQAALFNNTPALTIGSFNNTANGVIDGHVSDVRVANVAWTATEVANLYERPWDLFEGPRLFFSFPAVTVAGETVTHVTDAVLVKTTTASHATDAVLLAARTAQHATDADLLKTQAVTHDTDAVLLAARSATHDTDAVLSAARTAQQVSDAVLVAARTVTHAADAVLLKTTTATHLADAILTKAQTAMHATDAVLGAAGVVGRTAQHVTDAILRVNFNPQTTMAMQPRYATLKMLKRDGDMAMQPRFKTLRMKKP